MTVFCCPICSNVLSVEPLPPAQSASPADSPTPSNGDPLRTKIAAVKRRCTRTTGKVWDLVKAVAARQQPPNLQELAADLNATPASVLSWRRILGRVCHPRRLNIKIIGRAGGRYTMAEDVRRIVTELG
jgi:hypothetical protein